MMKKLYSYGVEAEDDDDDDDEKKKRKQKKALKTYQEDQN